MILEKQFFYSYFSAFEIISEKKHTAKSFYILVNDGSKGAGISSKKFIYVSFCSNNEIAIE